MDPLQLLVTNDLLRVLDLVGVFIMGVAAGAIAARLNFDVVGFAIIGITAGLGGGIVRDLILDFGVPAAFSSPWYLTCALAGSALSFLINAEGQWWRRLVTVLDIMAMGLWAATGTAKSLGYGLDALPAVLLGVASAVGGGVLRDVLVGRIPAIFGGGPLYATGSLLTAVLTWLVFALGLPAPTVLIAVAVGALLAGVAAWRRWSLPAHNEWQVTMSAAQLKRLVRRTRTAERERVAAETGAIPVVNLDNDDLAEDLITDDVDETAYVERVFHDGEETGPDGGHPQQGPLGAR
ncbi:trimeric intracellular cation channel family protein [Brachybacterium aquaticum]|uniref:Putative membrane protein YeiH n=1 Tax=Brachybacterium aquaticum TaxID=1432564 RepID=A0A841AE21_9MICO|nr:TRIC cation channel family protein [Brachybacterium aquaticum]MBB5831532.1 putative membrane protein YeiH [Brachybacterium aquaticum]